MVRLAVYAGTAVLAMLTVNGAAELSAWGSTSYVVDNTSTSCSDTGQGTSAQPFCTIAAAAKKALAGDTVEVEAGTYTGTSVNPTNSGVAGSPITFMASPGVTVTGGTKAFSLSNRSYIVISGFTISDTSSAGISISGGASDTVSRNVITGTGSYGISVSGGGGDTISGNTESFAGTPVASPAAGIYVSNLNGGLVQGNVTHDNSAHGIYLTGTTTGEGATAMGFYNVQNGDMPYFTELARNYAISDNYHQPVMGGTGPDSDCDQRQRAV